MPNIACGRTRATIGDGAFIMEELDGRADADGTRGAEDLRGDPAVVRARHDLVRDESRARAAVQAELDKIRPASARLESVPNEVRCFVVLMRRPQSLAFAL